LPMPYDGDLPGYNDVSGQTLPLSEEVPPIQLVGNSFVRPMWGLPQHVSRGIEQRMSTMFLRGDISPYECLRTHLRSVLPQRKPRLIVWQLSEADLHLGPAAPGYWLMNSQMSSATFLADIGQALSLV
jgi:hypothetical protein